MKAFRYWIPVRYMKDPWPNPIAVTAWETAIDGLIVQTPIMPARGRVHVTHKASGAALVFLTKKKLAFEIVRKLRRLPINFTCYSPAALYRQLTKLNDRQVEVFRTAIGHKGPMVAGAWRIYCKMVAANFDKLYGNAKRSTPAKPARRSKGGNAWKGKNRRKRP